MHNVDHIHVLWLDMEDWASTHVAIVFYHSFSNDIIYVYYLQRPRMIAMAESSCARVNIRLKVMQIVTIIIIRQHPMGVDTYSLGCDFDSKSCNG